jgi:hypothetical protein
VVRILAETDEPGVVLRHRGGLLDNLKLVRRVSCEVWVAVQRSDGHDECLKGLKFGDPCPFDQELQDEGVDSRLGWALEEHDSKLDLRLFHGTLQGL